MSMLVPDPLAERDPKWPYKVLASVRVTPQSTLRDLFDAQFELSEIGQLDPVTREACDALRVTRRRLAVDFFLYELADDVAGREP